MTVEPSNKAVIITVKRNLRLTTDARTRADAIRVTRHGVIALCSSAPSQIAAPTAIAL